MCCGTWTSSTLQFQIFRRFQRMSLSNLFSQNVFKIYLKYLLGTRKPYCVWFPYLTCKRKYFVKPNIYFLFFKLDTFSNTLQLKSTRNYKILVFKLQFLSDIKKFSCTSLFSTLLKFLSFWWITLASSLRSFIVSCCPLLW